MSNDITHIIRSDAESGLPPFIQRYIVQEVLYDPTAMTAEKAAELRKKYSTQLSLLSTAPHNSIIAQPARGHGEALSQSIILYPFFSHIHTPVKVGEHVWVMFELQDNRELGYWVSRIVEPRHAEDANYTHSDRRWVSSFKSSLKERSSASSAEEQKLGFPNGLGYPETFSLQQSSGKNAYDELVNYADAGKIHIMEPVPRYRKRPGDTVIEGSHNTLISLGQDRASIPAIYDDNMRAISISKADQSSLAGAIDIVVGRGQAAPSAPMTVENTRGAVETNKSSNLGENPAEGDPDYAMDLSRILIAMSTVIDEKLGHLPSLPNTFPEDDAGTPAASVLAKSDQIRIVARKDIKIVVAPPGADGETNSSDFASIVIKRSGDIIFSPSTNGVIKLGGEDADRAILCTDQSVVDPTSPVPGGRVFSLPIETTAAGKVGVGNGNLGAFATKVLVKGN